MLGKIGVVFGIVAVAVSYYVYTLSNANVSSVVVLALRYLARPHTDLMSNHVFKPIVHPSAWNGSYMAQNPQIWAEHLNENDKEALTNAITHFQALNKPTNQMQLVDFPLPKSVIAKIDSWKYQLGAEGRGFQLIRGVPVDKWTLQQNEIFFFAFGKYLGIPGAQDISGTLVGEVTDIGKSNTTERPYRQHADIAYHCDGSDIVGLLCLYPAKKGGSSRIISSVTMYNELLKLEHGQDYVRKLFGKVLLFTRKTFGMSTHIPVHPLRLDSTGVLRSYWNQEYYVKSYRHENGTLTPMGQEDPSALEAVEAYDIILNKDLRHPDPENYLGLDMILERGDIQLVSNHFVLHSRTEFEDYTNEEIAQAPVKHNTPVIGKRNLLRLWVSNSNKEMPWDLYLSKQWDLVGVLLGFLEGIRKYR